MLIFFFDNIYYNVVVNLMIRLIWLSYNMFVYCLRYLVWGFLNIFYGILFDKFIFLCENYYL